MRFDSWLICSVLLFLQRPLAAQTSLPANDAAALYEAADAVVARNVKGNITCPSNSSFPYEDYAFSVDWEAWEKADFDANTEARKIVRQARSMNYANWSPLVLPSPDTSSLSHLRELSNDLADAAIYQHLQGDDAAAFETIEDVLRISDLLKNSPNKKLLRFLVSNGEQALATERLNVITSNAVITDDPSQSRHLQVSVVHDWIRHLLDHDDAATQVNRFVDAEGGEAAVIARQYDIKKLVIVAKSGNAERDMSAMALACHLFHFRTSNWPTNVADLKNEMSQIPVDPFGDGKQKIGYVLIKAGLPDESDRPLIFCRNNSKDGMFYRNDRPFYGFYREDGSGAPIGSQKHGGQFRDVTSWKPNKERPPASTTQPLVP